MKKNKALCVLLAVLVLLPCLGLAGCGKTYEVEFNYNYSLPGDRLLYGKRIDVKSGQTLTHEYLTPRRTGYVFKGWFRNPSFTESSIWNSTDKVTSDVVLYAKWEPEN